MTVVTKKKPFPERLRELRYELGYTQERMARRIGVATITVQSWEQGRRRPGKAQLKLLCLTFQELS